MALQSGEDGLGRGCEEQCNGECDGGGGGGGGGGGDEQC